MQQLNQATVLQMLFLFLENCIFTDRPFTEVSSASGFLELQGYKKQAALIE